MRSFLLIKYSLTTAGQFVLVPNEYLSRHEFMDKVPLAFVSADMSLCVYHRNGAFMVLSNKAPEPRLGPSILNSKTKFSTFLRKYVQANEQYLRNKPICNILVNQSIFNGVGNYLRSEIMYRAEVLPCEDAFVVLSDKKRRTRIVNELYSVSLPGVFNIN